jgi:citrate lyase beta subunit
MSQSEYDEAARHAAAMRIVEDTAVAFNRGQMSFNRAKSIIDDALIGDADRIVRISSKPYNPEVTT